MFSWPKPLHAASVLVKVARICSLAIFVTFANPTGNRQALIGCYSAHMPPIAVELNPAKPKPRRSRCRRILPKACMHKEHQNILLKISLVQLSQLSIFVPA